MARATKTELTTMVVNSLEGELDLSDRLFEAGAGRHELYLSGLSTDASVATYDLFVRGERGIRKRVKVTIEILAP